MKAMSILENNKVVRDPRGLPNFTTLGQIQAAFHEEEIVIMVNHYLTNRHQWESIKKKGSDNFFGIPRNEKPVQKVSA